MHLIECLLNQTNVGMCKRLFVVRSVTSGLVSSTAKMRQSRHGTREPAGIR